ncbi:MAG: hypothetical protein CVU48_00020 [Candidatus Cloacimonetes bacterium HGW-Cloacimonetes-1]|jgi:hypothetical protein|nr:MAG: hypothetical protein CVU48_00020 [Candidatus Cloacimonetes bacterium HGW-Cloacimonetes-1]
MLNKPLILLLLITVVLISSCADRNTNWQDQEVLTLVKQMPVVGDPMDISIDDTNAYIALDQGGFSIINMTDYGYRWFTSLTAFDGSVVPFIRVRNVSSVKTQNKLFINETDGTDLIHIIDTTVFDSLRYLDSITGATQDVRCLKFFDIPNPTNQFTIEGMFTAGRKLNYGLFDGENNAWLGITMGISTPATATGFDVNATHFFVTTEQRGLQIYDKTDGAYVGSVVLPGEAQKTIVSGNYAYVTCQQSGLQIVDISNPATPTIVSGIDTEGYATGIDIYQNMVAVSSGIGGVYLFDVTSPSNPILMQNLTSCGYSNTVKFFNGKLIVASRDNGVLIYRID